MFATREVHHQHPTADAIERINRTVDVFEQWAADEPARHTDFNKFLQKKDHAPHKRDFNTWFTKRVQMEDGNIWQTIFGHLPEVKNLNTCDSAVQTFGLDFSLTINGVSDKRFVELKRQPKSFNSASKKSTLSNLDNACSAQSHDATGELWYVYAERPKCSQLKRTVQDNLIRDISLPTVHDEATAKAYWDTMTTKQKITMNIIHSHGGHMARYGVSDILVSLGYAPDALQSVQDRMCQVVVKCNKPPSSITIENCDELFPNHSAAEIVELFRRLAHSIRNADKTDDTVCVNLR